MANLSYDALLDKTLNHDHGGADIKGGVVGGVRSVDGIQFNNLYTPSGTEPVGRTYWNEVNGTISTVLKNGSTLDHGQELYFYGKASGAIGNGDIVEFAGAEGDHVLIKKAVASEIIAKPTFFIGIATQDIANGSFGYVTWFGEVNNIYTKTPANQDDADWLIGDILYFSNTTGQLTKTEPVAPQRRIEIAAVIKEQTGTSQTGKIVVRPSLSQRLSDLEDVDGSDPDATGDLLTWNQTLGVWERNSYNITDYLPLAGGTLTGDINFNKHKAIAMACDNGTTLPTSPVNGQWFLHTPTGRSYLYQYYSGVWRAITSFGTTTIYVDSVNGADSQDKGYGTGTNAYKTLNYAFNQLPGTVTGSVNIYLAAGTYTETVAMRSKVILGNYAINIFGATHTVLVSTFTADSSTTGTGTNHGTVTLTGAGWTVDAYKGKFLRCVTGTNAGLYIPIQSNTADTITIVGYFGATPGASDTYAITEPSSILTNSGATVISIADQQGIIFYDVHVVGSSATVVNLALQTNLAIYRSIIEGTPTSSSNYIFNSQGLGVSTFNYCVFKTNSDLSYVIFFYGGQITRRKTFTYSTAATRTNNYGLSGLYASGYDYDGNVTENLAFAYSLGKLYYQNIGNLLTIRDCTVGVTGGFLGDLAWTANIDYVNVGTNVSGTMVSYFALSLAPKRNTTAFAITRFASQTSNSIQFNNESGSALFYVRPGGGLFANVGKEDSDSTISGDNDTYLLHVDASNDAVTIGSNTELAKFGIDGNADEKQLVVQGNSTQTANLTEWQNSSGTVLANITPTGGALFSDKVIFTQTDGNEYIDSLADGYMDYRATTAHRFGDGTNQLVIESDGDTYWEGSGGLDFAEIYEEDGSSTMDLAAQDTYYQVTAFSANGESNGMTPDHTNDHITVARTGKYLATINISFYQTTAVAIEYDFHIKKNNGTTDFVCVSAHRDSGGATTIGNTSSTGIISLTAGDTVEVWVKRLDGGAVNYTIGIAAAMLTLVQIGG